MNITWFNTNASQTSNKRPRGNTTLHPRTPFYISRAIGGQSDGDQDQEEVEAEVEGAQEDISLPQRITRSKFKELGSSGRMFSLFVVSFV